MERIGGRTFEIEPLVKGSRGLVLCMDQECPDSERICRPRHAKEGVLQQLSAQALPPCILVDNKSSQNRDGHRVRCETSGHPRGRMPRVNTPCRECVVAEDGTAAMGHEDARATVLLIGQREPSKPVREFRCPAVERRNVVRG